MNERNAGDRQGEDELDTLMARLHAEMTAADVPPRLRALATQLQAALDARAADPAFGGTRETARTQPVADKTTG